jgi:hypothetical protein
MKKVESKTSSISNQIVLQYVRLDCLPVLASNKNVKGSACKYIAIEQ